MKTILNIILVILITGCNQSVTDKKGTATIPEIPTELDTLFDSVTSLVKREDDSGNIAIDTVVRKIPKVRKIFRKGIQYNYQANYYGTNGKLITSNRLSLIPTGKRIKIDPNMQDLVLIDYKISDTDKRKILNKHVRINKTYPLEQNWLEKSGEGIIENSEKVWMHPIRNNQYIFTEINGFPEVLFPLEIGKKWESNLSVHYGWGDWDGLEIESRYEITEKEELDLEFGDIDSWVINVEAVSDLGMGKVKYYFNEDLGFVKMDYENYKGERLIFEMKSIEQK